MPLWGSGGVPVRVRSAGGGEVLQGCGGAGDDEQHEVDGEWQRVLRVACRWRHLKSDFCFNPDGVRRCHRR